MERGKGVGTHPEDARLGYLGTHQVVDADLVSFGPPLEGL